MKGRVTWLGYLRNHVGCKGLVIRNFELSKGRTLYRLVCLSCGRVIVDHVMETRGK